MEKRETRGRGRRSRDCGARQRAEKGERERGDGATTRKAAKAFHVGVVDRRIGVEKAAANCSGAPGGGTTLLPTMLSSVP